MRPAAVAIPPDSMYTANSVRYIMSVAPSVLLILQSG